MTMKIKKWVIDKAQIEAQRYFTFFDFAKRTDDAAQTPFIEDDCYFMKVDEILKETEKAIQVKLSSGEIDGSVKGWKLWIPKSQIMDL